MEPRLFGNLEVDSDLAVFEPEQRDPSASYRALRCSCGGEVFGLSGWPRVATGRGGFFWRSLTRVWREARLPMADDGAPHESPFWLPVFARCRRCGREERLLDDEALKGHRSQAEQVEPRESYRCRICRRGSVALVAGIQVDAKDAGRAAIELIVCCDRCRRQARIAWSDTRPSDQEVRLDLLYGRR